MAAGMQRQQTEPTSVASDTVGDVDETPPASACTSGCIIHQARAQGPIYGHLHFKALGNT